MNSTFVIGDVHGHLRELKLLLDKSGATREDEIIQLGDLGHYGAETSHDDLHTWLFAIEQNITVLWGNHEAATAPTLSHRFRGYVEPHPETFRAMREKRMEFAAARHGVLLTHAGMHPNWGSFSGSATPEMVTILARLLNRSCAYWTNWSDTRDSISQFRGGWNPAGGLLWRDAREPLADVPQIFGHSRGSDIRVYDQPRGRSLCIDVCDKTAEPNLVGVWLPSGRIVAVGPDADFLERSVEEQV
jgi:predicted phosphodiesterase